MEIEEILRELDTIFRDILKNEYAPHHGHRKTLQHSFRPA